MKIPADKADRQQLYQDLADQCFRSRTSRAQKYTRNEQYYLYGTIETEPVTLNKLRPHIQLLKSYLYSEETTRFIIELGETSAKSELRKVRALTNHVQNEWHDSNTDMMFSEALRWGLVWDSTFLKFNWKRGGIHPYIIPPHNFGVYREDVTELSRQECFATKYLVTDTELKWRIKGLQHEKQIIDALTPGPAPADTQQYPQVVRDIITSSVEPNIVGVVDLAFPQIDTYTPSMPDKMITLTELWVFDDDEEQWRVVTQTDVQSVTIYDRLAATKDKEGRSLFIDGEIPFVQVRPRPKAGYFWGESEVSMLIALQLAISKRVEDIRHAISKQCRPSYAGIGMTMDTTEFRTAMDSEYGWVNGGENSGGKLENLAPKLPEDTFKEVEVMERYFLEASGISNVMKGGGEPGVRSRGQTDMLARLGSTPIKDRAMVIEDALDQIATLETKMIQAYDQRRLKYPSAEAGGEMLDFVASQFTDDFTVKVDAHSHSPIFVEDAKQQASDMLDKGIITKERYVELTKPPMKQQILAELPVIEAKQQQAAQQEAMQQQQERGLKAVK